MRVLRTVARRLAFGLTAAWGVVTIVFLLFTVTQDWVATSIAGNVRWKGADPTVSKAEIEAQIDELLSEYAAQRGLDRPLPEVYLDWMGNMVTLDWGNSFETGEPVYPMVTDAAVRTGMYVVPAVVLAVGIGMAVGLGVALRPESRLADMGRVGSYLAFSVPSFWVGGLLFASARGEVLPESSLFLEHLLPVSLTTMTLLGGYVSYSRAHALEHVKAEFVTLLRAKGGGPLTVARHVVRNAAIPLFAMLFTEALGLLVLSIFVIEVLFGIDGFGLVLFLAVDARDLPVLLGSTMIIIAVGIFGNIVQDLSYQFLDPRVGD